MNQIMNQGLKFLASQKPNTARRAAAGAIIGSVLGAIVFGPFGAVLGVAAFGGYGAYTGAVKDEEQGF